MLGRGVTNGPEMAISKSLLYRRTSSNDFDIVVHVGDVHADIVSKPNFHRGFHSVRQPNPFNPAQSLVDIHVRNPQRDALRGRSTHTENTIIRSVNPKFAFKQKFVPALGGHGEMPARPAGTVICTKQ
jgi:hypothetical protein